MQTTLIEKIRLFIPVSERDLLVVCELFKYKKFRKHEYFLLEGQVCKYVCFVKSGLFRYFINADGEEKTFSFGHEGCFLTDFESLVSQAASTQNIQALEESEVLIISKSDLHEFYLKVEYGERFGRMAMEYAIIDVVRELKSFYKDNELQRYRTFLGKYPEVQQRIPQYHIASYVGVKPQSLSRIRRRILSN